MILLLIFIKALNQPSSVTGCEIFDKEAESRAAARRAYVVHLLYCMRVRETAREPLHIEKEAGESWEAAMRHKEYHHVEYHRSYR